MSVVASAALLVLLLEAIGLIVWLRRKTADRDYVRTAQARAVELYGGSPGARAGDPLRRREPLTGTEAGTADETG